jgi:DNA-binding NarL/FixJ family response regulator
VEVESSDRIERLLALLLIHTMKGSTQAEQALQLSIAGFTNVEISNLLETTQGTVAQYRHVAKKKKKKKKKNRSAM